MPIFNEYGVLVDEDLKKIVWDDFAELANKLFKTALVKECTMVELSALSRDAEMTVSIIGSEVKMRESMKKRHNKNAP